MSDISEIVLYQSDKLFLGKVLKRPSKIIKSPYVADVILNNNINIDIISNIDININNDSTTDMQNYLAHSPSLGCCGLADTDANVLMTENKNSNTKTKYKIEFSIFEENHNDQYNKQIIAINPKIAEKVGYNAIINNCIKNLQNIKEIKTEQVFENSRFDISGIDQNNIPFILEIKNVPLADYVDVPKKDRKKYLDIINSKNINQKISYFPDGYRKNRNEPVSPRALKHIQELEKIKLEKNFRCILLFIIQRTDVELFQTSNLDLIYKNAVKKAHSNGVEIETIQVKWNINGTCLFFSNNLLFNLD